MRIHAIVGTVAATAGLLLVLLCAPLGSVAQQPPRPTQAFVIVAHPYGFDQKVIRARPGATLLVVQNRSGLDVFHLQIDVPSPPAIAKRLLRGERAHRQILTMSPGTYVLRELNHPAWSCRIEVSGGN